MISNKKKRQNAIVDILREKAIFDQNHLVNELEKQEIYTKQGTVSKDIDELNYYKDSKKGYIEKVSSQNARLDNILKSVIYYANPTFKRTSVPKSKIYNLYIYPKVELENSIAEIMLLRYNRGVVSITPGKRCVIVQMKTSKLANQLKEKLEAYCKLIL